MFFNEWPNEWKKKKKIVRIAGRRENAKQKESMNEWV